MKPSADAMEMQENGIGTLIAGYGNAWRGDDGAGPAVIARLEWRLRALHVNATDEAARAVRCVAWRQLMPEHALELRGVDEAWLIDASVELPAGDVAVQCISAEPAPVVADPFSHRWSPALLLQLARQINGDIPRMKLHTIGVAQLTTGAPLSPAVERAVERLARRLIRRCARRLATAPR